MNTFTFQATVYGHGQWVGYLFKNIVGEQFPKKIGGLNITQGVFNANIRQGDELTATEIQTLISEVAVWHPNVLNMPFKIRIVENPDE